MAVLGKRKAPQPEPTLSDQEAHEIFRRHFEARFNPLPAEAATNLQDEDEDEDDENEDEDDIDSDERDSAWGGLSNDDDGDEDEDDETPTVEVVDHSVSNPPSSTTMSKRELKAFMSSRPPDQTTSKPTTPSSSSRPSTSTSLPEDAPSLLAQDLELRRLLSESHLLAPSRSSSSSSLSFSTSATEPKSFASGRIRQKATDLRIQALGSKASILKQEKMPMHMRKGIAAAATLRESKRRREAKENGIILERETNNGKKRRRGGGFEVGRPGVGRMKGAELRISERDVKRIEGTRDTFGRRGKR